MKRNFKRRLAVFLTMMLVLPTIIAMLPMTSTKVSAANNYVYVSWTVSGYGSKTIQVEQGQTFYVGDYIHIEDGKWYGVASELSKVSYTSSNPSVVSVSKKGVFTAQTLGTAEITATYKGKKASCTFEIVAEGSFGKSAAATEMKKAAEKIEKKVKGKLTVSKAYAYEKVKDTFDKLKEQYKAQINDRGFLLEQGAVNGSLYKGETSMLAVPQAGRYKYLSQLLRNYGEKNNPLSTRSAKTMKIASASATTSGITVILKKKLTLEQIYGAHYNDYGAQYDPDKRKFSKKKIVINTYISDEKTHKVYSSQMTLVKGSKKIKIVPREYVYKNGVGKYKKTKLEKGHTYRIGYEMDWTKGKTVKVK